MSGWRSPEFQYVLLAGQATKLFVVHDAVAALGLTAEIVDRYQENAVTRGLCLQLGVLEGSLRDVLLLDAIPRRISLRCAEITERGNHDTEQDEADDHYDLVLGEPEQNTQVFECITPATTIPTRKTLIAIAARAEVHVAVLEALAATPDEHDVLADIAVTPRGRRMQIILDVESDATTLLEIRHGTTTRIRQRGNTSACCS